jgi:AAA domain
MTPQAFKGGEPGAGLTVAQYAEAKALPEEWLRDELGLRDVEVRGLPAVAIPYRGQDGEEHATRLRLSMNGGAQFAWPPGTHARGLVYGLDGRREAAARGWALLVEGESCVQTARRHGLPAFGIPGVGMFDDELTGPTLEGIEELILIREPGEAAAQLVEALRRSRLRVAVRVATLPHKDVSELHLAVGGDGEAFMAAIEEARERAEPLAEEPPEHSTDPPPTSWRPRSLLDAGGLPERRPEMLDGSVYPDSLGIFSGEPGVGKSWITLLLVAEQAAAGRAVLLIDLERDETLQLARLRALGLTDEAITRIGYLRPAEPAAPELLRELVAEWQPANVVIDSYDAALGLYALDPSKNDDLERFHRAVIEPLRSGGAAVVLTDHLAKDKERRGVYSIGGQRKLARADWHIRLDVLAPFARGRTGSVKLQTQKDNYGYLPRPAVGVLELVSDAAGERVTWTLRHANPEGEEGGTEAQPFRPTRLMEKVSLVLEASAEPLSRKQIEERVEGKREYVRQAADLLIVEGYAAAEEGKRGARLARSLRPYREADEAATSPRRRPGNEGATSPHLAPGGGARSNPHGRSASADLAPPRPDLAPSPGDHLAPGRPNTPDRGLGGGEVAGAPGEHPELPAPGDPNGDDIEW